MMTLKQAMKQRNRAIALHRLGAIKLEEARVAVRDAELREDMTSCGVQICPRHFHGNFSTFHPAK